MFVDEVEIHVAAGHGGKGALSFRREKFVPRGGPDGGDGGPGGNVYFVAHANLNTLLNFRFQKIFEAGNGAQGEGSNRTGKTGADIKLLADVGLVGYPNAGKSTIISRISAAKPKIAAYPFTTLVPNLGVVGLSGDRSFVVADVPGLIEGAHEGHGLGHRFLSHLERTHVLVQVIDISSTEGRDPVEDFKVISRELALFPGRDASGERLQDKPIVVAANKIDALDDPARLESLRKHLQAAGVPLYAVSAATGDGLPLLLEAVWKKLAEHATRTNAI